MRRAHIALETMFCDWLAPINGHVFLLKPGPFHRGFHAHALRRLVKSQIDVVRSPSMDYFLHFLHFLESMVATL
jgi:hypothetical protein